MKPKILFLLFFAAVLAAGCKKAPQHDKNNPVKLSSVASQEAAYLSFTSFDDYDGFISDYQSTSLPTPPQGFVSLRSVIEQLEWEQDNDEQAYLANPHLPDQIYENYGKLLDVLNEDKIVELWGNLVRVDIENEVVYVVNSTSYQDYQDLLNPQQAASVTVYQADDEVALILAGKSSGCSDPFAPKDKSTDDAYCSSNRRSKHEVTYQSAGIFFSLVAEVKNQQKTLGIWWSWGNGPWMGLYMNMWYKQRCGTDYGWYQDWAQNWIHANLAYSANSNKLTFRPYQSVHALTAYNFASSIHSCGGPHWHQIAH